MKQNQLKSKCEINKSAILGEHRVCWDIFSSLGIFPFAFIYDNVRVAKEKILHFFLTSVIMYPIV